MNYSVHDSTKHSPFFVSGLRQPRLPTLLECDSWIRREGIRSIKNRSGSCLLRVDDNVVMYDADVDKVDIEEEDHLINCDDAFIELDDDDDAGFFSHRHRLFQRAG